MGKLHEAHHRESPISGKKGSTLSSKSSVMTDEYPDHMQIPFIHDTFPICFNNMPMDFSTAHFCIQKLVQ
jgi:hypothetical protein